MAMRVGFCQWIIDLLLALSLVFVRTDLVLEDYNFSYLEERCRRRHRIPHLHKDIPQPNHTRRRGDINKLRTLLRTSLTRRRGHTHRHNSLIHHKEATRSKDTRRETIYPRMQGTESRTLLLYTRLTVEDNKSKTQVTVF